MAGFSSFINTVVKAVQKATASKPAPKPAAKSTPAPNRTYAPIASSVAGPNVYLNSNKTLTRASNGVVQQGIPNTPAGRSQAGSSSSINYPTTQQQSQQSQGSSGGYSAPQQFSNLKSTPYNFSNFLTSLNPVKPAYASDLGGPAVPQPSGPNILGGLTKAGNVLNDNLSLVRGFSTSGNFADRLRNLASGTIGNIGTMIGAKEFGVSERLRPGLQSGETSRSNQSVLGAQSPRQSFENPAVLAARASKAQNEGLVGLPAGTQPDNYGANTKDLYSQSDFTGGNGEDYTLLSDNLDANRQQLEQQIAEGQISQEDAILQQEQYQRSILEPYYNKLNEMAMSGIPQVQQAAATQVQRLQDALKTYESSAAPLVSNVNNTYGTAVRSGVENANLAKTQLRNIYAGLGSGESSQFLDSLRGIDQNLGTSTGNLEAQKGTQLGNINTSILDQRKMTEQKIQDVQSGLQTDLQSIRDRVDLNNLQKAQAIGDLVQNAQTAITDLQQKNRDILTNIDLGDRQALLDRQALKDKGQVDINNIYAQQQALNSQLGSSLPVVAPEADSVIKGFLQAPQSGGPRWQAVLNLKNRFSGIDDLVDLVLSGKVNLQNYSSVAQTQGTGNYNLGM